MNRNAIANKIYDELFPAAPAPAAPAPAAAPAPGPTRAQRVKKIGGEVIQGLKGVGKGIEKGVMATGGGIAAPFRFAARRTNLPQVQLRRAQLELENLKKRKEQGNTTITTKNLINKESFIEGVKVRLGRKGLQENNNSSFLKNTKPIPKRRSLRTSQNIFNAGREYKKTKSRQLFSNFQRAVLELQTAEANSSRRRNLLENFKSHGPSNRTFQNMVNRYIEREKSKPKTNNKGRGVGGATVTGNGRGGQQIIFGGGAPGQAPVAAPYPIQAPAAAAPYPFPMAGPAAAAPYPIPMGGGAPPQISVKVNTRGSNVGGVSLPPPSTSQVNMVQNAGGPVAIQKAVTALKRANGNVNAAMRTSGLPRQTFTNVKNLGGVNIAPRIAASVTRHRKRRTTTKKKTTHKVRKPSIRTNRIKKVVHKVPRKNLEHFVLLWALRRKR
jgi:hypothetical protein